MDITNESLRFILGIKAKQFRRELNLSLREVSQRSGLSVSYLSEIEKGKKYPKPDKINRIAIALERNYDELVSLQFDEKKNPVAALLNSSVFKELPLAQFGIGLGDIFELVSDSPSKVGALIQTLLEIGRTYDMHVEHFNLASLRSYQKMHANYFPEIEAAAAEFRKIFKIDATSDTTISRLSRVLEADYSCTILIKDLTLMEELKTLRSIWMAQSNTVIVNQSLSDPQKIFVLLREIGFRRMNLDDRPVTSSSITVDTFEQALNNFKASYFAGAVVIPESSIVADLTQFFQLKTWEPNRFLAMMDRYGATAELFLYRLSQLTSHHFGLQNMHYMRVHNKLGQDQFQITKELNTTNIFTPRGIGPMEHHCRRWVSVGILQELARSQQRGEKPRVLLEAQRSRFISRDEAFFNFAMGRPLTLASGSNSGMTLGFQMNQHFKETVRFWNDPNVANRDVNETCERCSLSLDECTSRVAPSSLLDQKRYQDRRQHALEAFMAAQAALPKA